MSRSPEKSASLATNHNVHCARAFRHVAIAIRQVGNAHDFSVDTSLASKRTTAIPHVDARFHKHPFKTQKTCIVVKNLVNPVFL